MNLKQYGKECMYDCDCKCLQLYVLDEVRIERSSNISMLLSLQVSQDGLTFTQVAKSSRKIDGGEVGY